MLKVFIGCLPGDCDKQELSALIETFASIKKLALVTHQNASGQSYCKGYGFAICQSQADLDTLAGMDGKIYYRDRPLTFRRYKTGSSLCEEREAFNRRRVFVGNIPAHLDETRVMLLLARFGPIKKVYFIASTSNQKLKFGYAVFHHESSAQYILSTNPKIQTCGLTLRIESFGGKKTAEERLEEPRAPPEKRLYKEMLTGTPPLSLRREVATPPSSAGHLLIRRKEGLAWQTWNPFDQATAVIAHSTHEQFRAGASKFDRSLSTTNTLSNIQQNHQPSNIRLNVMMHDRERILPPATKRKPED